MEQIFGKNSIDIKALREFCEREGKEVTYRKGDQLDGLHLPQPPLLRWSRLLYPLAEHHQLLRDLAETQKGRSEAVVGPKPSVCHL